MSRYWGVAAMLAAISWSPTVSQAQENAQSPSVWTGCGDLEPTAAQPSVSEAFTAQGIERCTAALAALPPDAAWERRAALLRSRARFHIAARHPKDALADLDAIAAIEKPDAPYARSFGVSLTMLRALAYMQAGRRDDAGLTAMQAMQARPWSLRVARFAFSIATLRANIPAGEKARWDNLVRLDPHYFQNRALDLVRAGNWNAALDDWQHATPAPGDITETYIMLPKVTVRGMPGIPVPRVDIDHTAQAIITAYVMARPDLADGWLAKAKRNIIAPRKATDLERYLERDLNFVVKPEDDLAALDQWTGLFEAAALIGKGDAERAIGRLEARKKMPFSKTAIALMHRILSGLPPDGHADFRAFYMMLADQSGFEDEDYYISMYDPVKVLSEIPDHEDAMPAMAYRDFGKSLDGNQSIAILSGDDRTAEFRFSGNKSHPLAIGEMLLLRAADLAVARGKPAFRVIGNDDAVQISGMTMYGAALGSATLLSYRTQLKIEFVNASAAQGRPDIIQASDVRAALMPIYVKADAK